MLTDQTTTEAIKALIGQVEWVYHLDKPGAYTGLDLIFRVGGELRGLTFYLHEPGLLFGQRGRENRYPGANSLVIKPLERERMLTVATYLELKQDHPVLLTDAERAEWDGIVARNAAKREKNEQDEAQRQREIKRRQYEELKKEFKDEN